MLSVAIRSYLASRFKGTPAGDVMVAAFNAVVVPIVHAGRVVRRAAWRAHVARVYALPPVAAAVRWLATSREVDNFRYPITRRNVLHIAAAVAVATDTPPELAERYMRELQDDIDVAAHLAANGEPALYARRVGWYAIARITKPGLIVETGVHRGIGTVVLCAALARNAAEGKPGQYYGTDINPGAGALLSGAYAEYGEILYGDSLTSLERIAGPIGLFINDSDHSPEYERREYVAVNDKLAPGAIILSDNAHETDELLAFSRSTGRRFLFVAERPERHFYPGAGIGISWAVAAGVERAS